MEITEQHIEDVWCKIEVKAMKEDNRNRAEGMISAAATMRAQLFCVLAAKSENDYLLGREKAVEFVRILKLTNGNVLSYTYACDHNAFPQPTNVDVTIYKQWKESGSKDCFNCWKKQ